MSLNILVTGGAGYIGAHCCKALSDAGFRPVCYDDLSLGNPNFVRWGPLEVGDIRDKGRLLNALLRYEIKAVIHCAALSVVADSIQNPAAYYDINVGGTLSLLDTMCEAKCFKLILSSTCAVYGIHEGSLLNEETPCNPITPYARSKLAAEQIASDYQTAYGLHSFRLRYFNAAGADPSGRIGEKRFHETHLIPRAIMAAAGEIERLKIFGDDHNTRDGTAIRDYVHVSDLAAAHVTATRCLLAGHKGDCLNLGSGNGHSVLEVLASIREGLRLDVPYTINARREGDAAYLVADITKAAKTLQFSPATSDLKSIISTAWLWHRAPHTLAHQEVP